MLGQEEDAGAGAWSGQEALQAGSPLVPHRLPRWLAAASRGRAEPQPENEGGKLKQRPPALKELLVQPLTVFQAPISCCRFPKRGPGLGVSSGCSWLSLNEKLFSAKNNLLARPLGCCFGADPTGDFLLLLFIALNQCLNNFEIKQPNE